MECLLCGTARLVREELAKEALDVAAWRGPALGYTLALREVSNWLALVQTVEQLTIASYDLLVGMLMALRFAIVQMQTDEASRINGRRMALGQAPLPDDQVERIRQQLVTRSVRMLRDVAQALCQFYCSRSHGAWSPLRERVAQKVVRR